MGVIQELLTNRRVIEHFSVAAGAAGLEIAGQVVDIRNELWEKYPNYSIGQRIKVMRARKALAKSTRDFRESIKNEAPNQTFENSHLMDSLIKAWSKLATIETNKQFVKSGQSSEDGNFHTFTVQKIGQSLEVEHTSDASTGDRLYRGLFTFSEPDYMGDFQRIQLDYSGTTDPASKPRTLNFNRRWDLDEGHEAAWVANYTAEMMAGVL